MSESLVSELQGEEEGRFTTDVDVNAVQAFFIFRESESTFFQAKDYVTQYQLPFLIYDSCRAMTALRKTNLPVFRRSRFASMRV